jgi:hypothetical protein
MLRVVLERERLAANPEPPSPEKAKDSLKDTAEHDKDALLRKAAQDAELARLGPVGYFT